MGRAVVRELLVYIFVVVAIAALVVGVASGSICEQCPVSACCETVEFTGVGGGFYWRHAGDAEWVYVKDCPTSPCTVEFPDPGDKNVEFYLEGVEDMRVVR